jgi:uncharacterized membrane protein YadS
MLLPVVFTIAFVVSRGAKGGQGGAKVTPPLFLVGFAALVAPPSIKAHRAKAFPALVIPTRCAARPLECSEGIKPN